MLQNIFQAIVIAPPPFFGFKQSSHNPVLSTQIRVHHLMLETTFGIKAT
jgi:hypothetical protein